jgi:hypothetical protein
MAFMVDEALALRLVADATPGPDPTTGVQVAPESAYES